MKKVLLLALSVALLVPASGAKTKSDTVLVPHAAANPENVEPSNRDRDRGFARQVGRPFGISAGMIARDDHTVGLLLKITNASAKELVFAPDEIVVAERALLSPIYADRCAAGSLRGGG